MRAFAKITAALQRLQILCVIAFVGAQIVASVHDHDAHGDVDTGHADLCAACLIKSSNDEDGLDDVSVRTFSSAFAAPGPEAKRAALAESDILTAFPRDGPPPGRGPPLS